MKIVKGFVVWLARIFDDDNSSDWVFGIMGGVVAFFMLAHVYSFFAALAGGLGLFAVIVIMLRLAVSSPRFTVVVSALALVAMTVVGSGLSHLVK